MKERMAKALAAVRQRAPLVQCITNFVTVNDCANIILAAGGSPTMAMDVREVEEAVAGVQALVCNMGAIEHTESMRLAGQRANGLGIPVVLDPVAAGGTALRRRAAAELLDSVRFSAIRGNASEIGYLAGEGSSGSGVDVSAADAVNEDRLPSAAALVAGLSRRTGAVIALSGPLDIVSDGEDTLVLRNGCAAMARITGSGCMLTAMMGAFCGALPEDRLAAAAAAMTVMGIAGELAERKMRREGSGNASLRTYLIDAVFNMTEEELRKGARYEIYRG